MGKIDLTMILIIESLKKRRDAAFDISECSYDHYPREDVIRAEKECKELTTVIKKLEDLYMGP